MPTMPRNYTTTMEALTRRQAAQQWAGQSDYTERIMEALTGKKKKKKEVAESGRIIRKRKARNIGDLSHAGMNEVEYHEWMNRACIASRQLTTLTCKMGQFFNLGNGGEYWCRESNMSEVRKRLEEGKANTAVHLMVYSREKVADTLLTYFKRVEKIYNFKGTLTSVREEAIPASGLRSKTPGQNVDKCNILTFRTADEWHRSPTTYQVYNLLVRLIIMSLNGYLDKRAFDLNRWDEDSKDILAPFDFEMMKGKGNHTDYGERMSPSLKKYVHVVLSQRHLLFSRELKYEWSATEGETEYGVQEYHTLFANSGIYAFGKAVDRYFSWGYDIRIKSKHLPPYFKFYDKVKVIEVALQNCGMYTGQGGR